MVIYIGRTLKWLVAGVAGLVVLLLVLLYVPAVQDFAVGKALDTVNASGDMHIAVKQVRLRFPLRLSVDSLSLEMPAMGVKAQRAEADMALLPLFSGTLFAPRIVATEAKVRIGTPDSALYMNAALSLATVKDAFVALAAKEIGVMELRANTGSVTMAMKPDTVPTPPSPTESDPWEIHLEKARLENFAYQMQLYPTITDLSCTLPLATLQHAEVSMARHTVKVDELTVDRVDARYITPTAQFLAENPVPEVPEDTLPSEQWTVTARRLLLTNSHAIYATEGAIPTENFDPSYIEASEINLQVDSFRNRGMEVTVPLTRLTAREHCGIALDLTGLFSMDSTSMQATRMRLTTPASVITLDGSMGLDTINPALSLVMDASLGIDDVRRLVPPAALPIVKSLPQYQPILLTADISGHLNSLHINGIGAEIPRHAAVTLRGNVADYTDINRAHGNLKISGNVHNGDLIHTTLLQAKMSTMSREELIIPRLALNGDLTLRNGVAHGDVKLTTPGGGVAMKAMWNNRAEDYDLNLALNTFPIQNILPKLGAKNIDGTLSAQGTGLDPLAPHTRTHAHLDLRSMTYLGRDYRDVTLDATLLNGHLVAQASSANRTANFTLTATADLKPDFYDVTFNGNVKNIDLKALGLTPTVADGSIRLQGRTTMRPAVAATRRHPGQPMMLTADVDVAEFYWHMPGDAINGSDVKFNFVTDDSITSARLTNRGLALNFRSPLPLDTIMTRLTAATEVLTHGMKSRQLAIDSLQQALPPFNFTLRAQADNLLTNYLAGRDINFGALNGAFSNDSLLWGNLRIDRITLGETKIDTLALNLHQSGSYLLYDAQMTNNPGTFDEFAEVNARGYLSADHLAVILKQQNIQGETGYSIGFQASMSDSSTVAMRIVPYHPIIGYKDWDINKNNFISYNLRNHHVDADLHLFNPESSLKLYTQHVERPDSLALANAADSTHAANEQEDIVLQLSKIKLQDWIALNPFAPPVQGDLSADMHVQWHQPYINGTGTVSLSNFTYDRKKVADFDLDLDVSTTLAGTIRANAALMVNGVKTMTAAGNLNDSTATNPFLLDFKMIKFPLEVVNPFLPAGTATLAGTLNGEMDVTGSLTAPLFNGYVDFDRTSVTATPLGTPFTFSEEKIPVVNNVVNFSNFTIKGLNEQPLTINGTVKMEPVSNPRLDLAFTARNMQIIGGKRNRRSQAYGKAFVNIDSRVRGNMNFLDVQASLNLLSGSNFTYIIPDAVSMLTSRSNQDLVKFVNFADTAAVAEADTVANPSMLMNIDASLTVSPGSVVGIDLSTDGKNRVQVQANGTINYTQDFMDDQQVTGRININSGYARYTIPVMGEKLFNFKEGSYVNFNGDMMNPVLNILTVDNIRANVSGNNTNRVVNFDVGLDVTGTLENMNVVFDLSCPDDLSLTNELQAMSPEQRANQAMNLLISGMYHSGTTQTINSGGVGTNALFGFLESQLNSWASSAIKGVDISFGINQYDKTVDGANTTAMNYSYQVSKSLFDDRFKIVVGGNYTTDAEADENFAQNLIADISFEYLLNKSGSMYVRLFRHTGFESILEGEITQTGVGFVYKRKIRHLIDLFRIRRARTGMMIPQVGAAPTIMAAPTVTVKLKNDKKSTTSTPSTKQ